MVICNIMNNIILTDTVNTTSQMVLPVSVCECKDRQRATDKNLRDKAVSACLLYKTCRCSKVISLVKKYEYKRPNYTIGKTHSLETKQYRELTTVVPRPEFGTEKPILVPVAKN